MWNKIETSYHYCVIYWKHSECYRFIISETWSPDAPFRACRVTTSESFSDVSRTTLDNVEQVQKAFFRRCVEVPNYTSASYFRNAFKENAKLVLSNFSDIDSVLSNQLHSICPFAPMQNLPSNISKLLTSGAMELFRDIRVPTKSIFFNSQAMFLQFKWRLLSHFDSFSAFFERRICIHTEC